MLRKISLASLFGYVLFFVVGIMFISGVIPYYAPLDEGEELVCGAGIAFVFLCLALLAFSFLPIIFKFILLDSSKRFLNLLCIPFDLVLLFLSGLLVRNFFVFFDSYTVISGIVACILALVAFANLIFNVFCIARKPKEGAL